MIFRSTIAPFPLTETLIDLRLQNRPPLEKANNKGIIPLMYAARKGELLMATKLITCGASTQIKSNIDLTALHYAANHVTEPEMIILLIKEGALIGAKDEHMTTPLHVAAGNRARPVKVVECLLQAGAGIEARAQDGSTPLHLAAKQGNASCIGLLMKCGAEIEARATLKRTPLHAAVGLGKLSSVKTLLDHGANPLARAWGDKIPREIPTIREVTEEVKEEINGVLREAETAWKRSGKKSSRWGLFGRR